MTLHEIKPTQLRALLLLLVLLPFIPMVLMFRFMLDALGGERDAALERARAVYQQTLANAGPSLEKHLGNLGREPTPHDALRFYRTLFDPEIDITISDKTGLLAGSPPRGKSVAQTALRPPAPPWHVQLSLADNSSIDEAVRGQLKVYAWTAAIAVISVCSIAAAAGLAVSRQLTLHELKTTSVATVAHELRTPLASMRMLVETLLEGRCRSPEQLREYLEIFAAENLRLSRLTEHFLTLSRLERGTQRFEFAPVSPRTIVERAVAALRTQFDAPGCIFSLELAEPLPAIAADRDALASALTNLLENALKYSGAEKRIGLRVFADKGALVFAVSDNGIGLNHAERKRIFQPFYQADQKLSRAREGCGLGLSIVHEIAAAHHGRVEVQSEPGKGSTFVVTVPVPSMSRHAREAPSP